MLPKLTAEAYPSFTAFRISSIEAAPPLAITGIFTIEFFQSF